MAATEKDMKLPDFWKHMSFARDAVDAALVKANGGKKHQGGAAIIAAKRDPHRSRVIDDLAALLARVAADT